MSVAIIPLLCSLGAGGGADSYAAKAELVGASSISRLETSGKMGISIRGSYTRFKLHTMRYTSYSITMHDYQPQLIRFEPLSKLV